MFVLFYRLPRVAAKILSGWNLLGHALAIGLTILIVESGFDWHYYLATRAEVFLVLARPAIRLGALLPIWGTLGLLLVGAAINHRRLVTTAWAMGQVALLGYLVASSYKALTGRLPPPFSWRYRALAADGIPPVDSSHGFQFGFLKGGIFWGWPSSHTTVAFAVSVCLATLYPKNKALAAVVLLYALYIGLGVSVTIHWFSEFVAGMIFGTVIGLAVGKSFKARPEI
jgi:membrane-associated phospholipid phosphatase